MQGPLFGLLRGLVLEPLVLFRQKHPRFSCRSKKGFKVVYSYLSQKGGVSGTPILPYSIVKVLLRETAQKMSV